MVELFFRAAREPWRERLLISGYLVLVLLYQIPEVEETTWGDPRTAPWGAALALYGAGAVVLAFRARATVAAFFAAMALLAASFFVETSLPITVVAVDLIYSLMAYGPRRVSRVIAAVLTGSCALLIALLFLFEQSAEARVALSLTIGCVLVPLLWGLQIRTAKERTEAERTRAELERESANHARDNAVAAERARMARDLHDVIAGHVSAVAFQSEAAIMRSKDDSVAPILGSIRENSVKALEEMRSMIRILHERDDSPDDERLAPPGFGQLGLVVDTARTAGVDLAVDLAVPEEIPRLVELVAYRIVQEALTNVMKHAPGSRASLEVRAEGRDLVLLVRNDFTVKVPAAGGTGVGTVSMAERARTVGGSVRCGPVGDGWRVEARLPVGDRSAPADGVLPDSRLSSDERE
ncbi:sensor histidine kinase [Salininema proteolyticum]|uniref:histidine kinase n=1 Tax=Salininema proteolyticum TaxID=1607685 RepID=A0ABV8TTQ3_9ACTN